MQNHYIYLKLKSNLQKLGKILLIQNCTKINISLSKILPNLKKVLSKSIQNYIKKIEYQSKTFKNNMKIKTLL